MINHRIFIIILLVFVTQSCKTLMSYVNIVKCDFRMESVKNVELANINVQGVRSISDLNFFQAGQLTKAYLSGNVPLEFLLNLEGINPNTTSATMANFDWILYIDDVKMVSGTNNQEYTIPPNDGTQIIPLKISINLLDVLNDEAKDALLNFGFNLADAGNKPTRIGLQLKPTLNVGGVPITYPGFIDLGTEFGNHNE